MNTLLDRRSVLSLYDRQMRREAAADGQDVRVERAGPVVRQSGTGDDWNGVLWSDVDAATADAVIAEQIGHYTALGHAFEWKLYAHDAPADLGARLTAAGFSADPVETVMVADTAAVSAEADLPEGVRLVRVTDADGVALMAQVHEQAFGTGASYARRLAADLAAAPDSVEAVLAMSGDVPVCAARMELPPGKDFAGLWGGGTVPGWRGRGLYRALVARRAGTALARGYRYLQVDAMDTSRPILARLGFTVLTSTTPYRYDPTGR